MSRTHDNWEKLVSAVLRKIWKMFHAPSVSSISSFSSYSSAYLDPPPDVFLENDVRSSDGVGYDKFESRKHVLEEILEALLHHGIYMIGICGVGGIGKTTMAKRIAELVKKEEIFNEVILTVVGQRARTEKIQGDIAEALGLKLEEKCLRVRARRLNTTIRERHRSILIILDDISESLALEDVGIPFLSRQESCKIIFTSRNQDVLEVQAQKVFRVEVLPVDEAWILLKNVAGKKVEDPSLKPLAEEVAKECKGVPLSIVTLGSALMNKDKSLWKEALVRLRSRSTLSTIPRVLDHVYKPLKLSYACLSEETRSLLLFCCLFKQDSDIFVEELVRLGIGLQIFDDIVNLEQLRNGVFNLVTTLKTRFLIEDGCNRATIRRIHDVVRDVAIVVEKSQQTSLFLTCTTGITEASVHPNLRFLRLHKVGEVPDNVFDRMRELNAFVMEDMCIQYLPPSLHLATELQTLHLHSCDVESIALVGQLLKLEIFSCFNCPRIEVLPAETGKLSNLRLLEVYKCPRLTTIAAGVISGLFLLEELKLRGSFDQWEAERSEDSTNAALSELQSLSNLTTLEIEIQDSTIITTDIQLPFQELKKFCIRIGDMDKGRSFIEEPLPYKIAEGDRYMHISVPNRINTAPKNWILDLLGSGPIPDGSFNNLSELKICDMPSFVERFRSRSQRAIGLYQW